LGVVFGRRSAHDGYYVSRGVGYGRSIRGSAANTVRCRSRWSSSWRPVQAATAAPQARRRRGTRPGVSSSAASTSLPPTSVLTGSIAGTRE
jgi:hypothetical protein